MEYKRRASRKKKTRKINYKKMSVIISAIIMIITISVGFFYSQKKNQAVIASNKVTRSQEKVETSFTSTSLFMDDKQIFLKPDITMEDLSQLRIEADKMENGAQKDKQIQLLGEASDKRYILTALTNLYQDAVRGDGTIDTNVQLKPEVTVESVNTLKKTVEGNRKKDAFYQQVWSLVNKGTTASTDAIEQTDQAEDVPE